MIVADLTRAIAGSVVDQNDFEIRILELFERRQAALERIGGVVRAHHDGHARPRQSGLPRKRRVLEGRRDRCRRRLDPPIPIDQTKGPIVNRMTTAPPFVRPAERDGTAGALLKRRADVHGGDFGLAVFAFANRVGARFRQEQRLLARDMLQAREIGAQLGFTMQVDVDGVQVEERKIQKLGGREVHVGEELVGRCPFGVLIELAQKTLDPKAAVPAHDAWRNLVTEGDQGDRGMAAELTHSVQGLASDGSLERSIVEKGDML